MGIKENFKRGSLEMLILHLLLDEEMYGYQLTQEISIRSNGTFKITEGSMYPTLYRLVDKGLISDRLELVGRRRTRVYYRIEEKGKEYLKKLRKEYDITSAGIEAIMTYVHDPAQKKEY
ncbi:MAG: PadR family transcriptional regulator [Eubacterium sp.]|nr:PadR family transcriptional regulator [Eubacterium sp.]